MILRMLSTNSLSAFSSATTASALNRSSPLRLVRDQPQQMQQPAPSMKSMLPNAMPSVAPPRGSLLNLSV